MSGIKEAQLEALSKELDGLNFGRYVTEAADALAEGKFKLNDVAAVVTIASKVGSEIILSEVLCISV